MKRPLALFCLCAALQGGVVVRHDYDTVSDAVVSWRLEAGGSVGQSFTVPPGTRRMGGFRVKLQRVGTPGPLSWRIGRRPGGAELGSGTIAAEAGSP